MAGVNMWILGGYDSDFARNLTATRVEATVSFVVREA